VRAIKSRRCDQGDQICSWKNRPKCSPKPYFVKIDASTLQLNKVSPQKCGLLLQLPCNCPKQTINHLAKSRPIWSPWRCQRQTFHPSFRISTYLLPNACPTTSRLS
jgi:hypothetical protein